MSRLCHDAGTPRRPATRRLHDLLACALFLASLGAQAQDVLIRNATVHTLGAQGTLAQGDVLVRAGKVSAIGTGLVAPAGVAVVEAEGRPLTPTLFGGINEIGLEEVSGERSTVDANLALGAENKQMTVRPEFDVTLAFNPESVLIPVARIEGLGWTLLAAGSAPGGSIIAGQGAPVRLDGSPDPAGARVLFVNLGSDANNLSGHSRAGQWMLLDQLIDEARGRIGPDNHAALLTPAGRRTLARYLDNGGRMIVHVNRAADIRQLLRWSARHKVQVAILGGAEAWKLGASLAAAKVPVFVDPLGNLPASFDELGARMDNAALLHAAGVPVSFALGGDASHYARKVRQLAGNAVAAGLPWEAGLAGLTRIPADALGVGSLGRIAVGQRADLALWSGDPLDVSSVALQVWQNGQAIEMRSRQTELRDRYLRPENGWPRAYPAPAGQ